MLLAAGRRGVPCASYTPQQVKQAVCGTGRAAKDQVARMVCALLGLPDEPLPDHATDALAVGVCHVNHAPLAQAVAGAPRDRAGRGEVAVRRPDHVVVGLRRASATAWRSRPRRSSTSPRSAGRSRCSPPDRARRRAALYGFATEEERDLFLLLIGVQSVGPKMALPCSRAARRAS